MSKEKCSAPEDERKAISPERREDQIIAMAMDEAEKRIRDGTASNQLLVHFLKLGSTKDRLEKEILAEQKKLIKAKTSDIESARDTRELFKEAISAMKTYSGEAEEGEEDGEY